MNDTTDLFAKIVGQDTVKRKLNFFLKGYNATPNGTLPNFLFSAAKGLGKTFMAKEFRKGILCREGENAGAKAKPLLNINCSTIKSLKNFISLMTEQVNEKEITILLDEASELPHDVTMSLLSILQPNPEGRNSFSYEDYTLDFDFSRQHFIFCTSETQRVFPPLIDRLERINLENYSLGQLEEIVKRNLPDVIFEDEAIANVSSVLRGNARSAQKMATNIQSYLQGENSKVFMMDDWKSMSWSLGIRPLGLSPVEITVLHTLAQHEYTSLTRLSAVTGLSRESLQKDVEMYLQTLDLIGVATTGRFLTQKGRDYLNGLVC